MRRLLHEPLVQFLLLGAVLFGAWQFAQGGADSLASSKQIRLTVDELTQLDLVFRSQWRREPTAQEFSRLVENRVQEEVLYREALAMGLEKDDTIVKRRMAQKMQFLAEDVGAAREPDRAELESWYANNSSTFAQPTRVSFRHLYFSPDRRGSRAHEDAASALAKLAGQPQDFKAASSIADSFMFQEYYRDRAPDQLAKEFGPPFALAVARLEPGSWQGPIQSGLGWHLIFIDTAVPGTRARARGSRSGGEDSVAGRAKDARVAEGLQRHARQVHGAAPGVAGCRRAARLNPSSAKPAS